MINSKDAILHLQTHIYDYNGLLPNEKEKKCKIIYTLHGVIPYYYMPFEKKKELLEGKLNKKEIRPFLEFLNEREIFQATSVSKADSLIVLCEAHKRAVRLLYNYSRPIFIVENATEFMDEEIRKIINAKKRKQKKFEKEKIKISYYNKKISLGMVLEAFSRLRDRYRLGLRIFKGEREKLPEEVEVVGWKKKSNTKELEELIDLYLTTDIFLQPVKTPNLFSKIVLDAMALQIPVVSCPSEYTFSSRTVEEICNSIEFIIKNREKVKIKVENAYNKVATENTWKKYVESVMEIASSFY